MLKTLRKLLNFDVILRKLRVFVILKKYFIKKTLINERFIMSA